MLGHRFFLLRHLRLNFLIHRYLRQWRFHFLLYHSLRHLRHRFFLRCSLRQLRLRFFLHRSLLQPRYHSFLRSTRHLRLYFFPHRSLLQFRLHFFPNRSLLQFRFHFFLRFLHSVHPFRLLHRLLILLSVCQVRILCSNFPRRKYLRNYCYEFYCYYHHFKTVCCWTSVSLAAPFASPVTNHAASSQLAATSTASATSTGFTLNSTVPAASSSTGTSTTTAAKTAVAATATVESLPSLNHTLHNFVRRSLAPSRTRHRVRGRGKQSNVRRGSHNMQRVPQQQSLQQVLDNEAYKFGNQFVHQRYGKRPQEEEDATIKISQHQSSTVLSSIPENINRRVGEWIEPKEVILPADVFKRINGPAECKGERYAPQWDVNPNESLDYDFPEQGGTLGHRMLKGMILPRDCPSRVSKLIFANTSHQLAQFCGSYLEVAELGLHYQRHNAWLSDELLDVTNRLKDAEQEAASAKTAINAAIVSKEAAEKHLAEAKQAWNLEKSSLESNIIDLKKQLLAMKEEKDGAEKEALKL
ncbi:uncharacterized protein [Spinacia oleracea]|uniref:Uncharacterized protein isoform X3 n=1 Tax=Spinacia oleracea TaxID=3562 RepID=A0A9R0J7B5_SPIOL|nr:uncharacterized protein LOC110800332 isoform X3 [Spinacia oleracea]